MSMKRVLAFILCLVMVLGLFTGVASAETIQGALSIHWDGNDSPEHEIGWPPFGDAGMDLYYTEGSSKQLIPNDAEVSVLANGETVDYLEYFSNGEDQGFWF